MPMTRGMFVLALTLSGVLLGHATGASGQTFNKDTLRGLPGLMVAVEPMEADAERDGLRTADIQMDVELQLRLAGIRVLSQVERLALPAQPYLDIEVTTEKRPDPLYAFNVAVEVHQLVYLASSGNTTSAVTWIMSTVGTTGHDNIRQLREAVKDKVSTLINDWLTMNPKP